MLFVSRVPAIMLSLSAASSLNNWTRSSSYRINESVIANGYGVHVERALYAVTLPDVLGAVKNSVSLTPDASSGAGEPVYIAFDAPDNAHLLRKPAYNPSFGNLEPQ